MLLVAGYVVILYRQPACMSTPTAQTEQYLNTTATRKIPARTGACYYIRSSCYVVVSEVVATDGGMSVYYIPKTNPLMFVVFFLEVFS